MSSQMHADNDSGAEHTAAVQEPLTLLLRNWGSAQQNKGYYGVWLLVVRRTYICDHFPSGLVPFSVVSPLQFLLEHTLSGRAVLQGKFAQDFAEAVHADLARRVHRVAQEQEKGVEPADNAEIRQRGTRNRRRTSAKPYLLMILLCTIFRMMILSAQSLRKSDIFCFNAGFISCLAMTLR